MLVTISGMTCLPVLPEQKMLSYLNRQKLSRAKRTHCAQAGCERNENISVVGDALSELLNSFHQHLTMHLPLAFFLLLTRVTSH